MTLPVTKLEVAWSTDPFATTPTWTDLSSPTSYVRSASAKRGRGNAFSRIEAGQAVVSLDDRDLRFDPFNTAGAYYPNVKPGKKARLSCTYNAVTYYLFTGYIDELPPTYLYPGETIVNVPLVDVFGLLALADLTVDDVYPDELAGTRVGRVLDEVGFPAADRALDAGQSTIVTETVAADTKALAHLLDVAESELGIVFVDGQGRVAFHDRHHRIGTVAAYTPDGTFGLSGGSELDYATVVPAFTLAPVVNEWSITPDGGTVIVKSDSASITAYGKRASSRSPKVVSVNDCTAQAEYLLAQTKEPALRFERLELRPARLQAGTLQDNLFAQALGREIGDRIQVKVRPPGAGYTITQDCYIETIEHAIGPHDWATSFGLSAVDPTVASGNGYWILGDSTYGVLGTTTRLAP